MMLFRRTSRFIVLVISLLSFCVTGHAQIQVPDVEFVPTPQIVVIEMLKMAGVTKDDVVYDLGCGDGRLVITAAKEFGARGVGVDIDPQRIKESNENALKTGVTDRVKFLEQDFFQTNISEATVVTLYLLDELNLQLQPKLFRELKPGTRIVSHDFDMGDWKPDNTMWVYNANVYYPDGRLLKRDTKFYYWVIPADTAGIWRWAVPISQGERQYTLNLHQRFQEIAGKVNVREREIPIDEPRLVGEQLSFAVRDEINGKKVVMRFSGRIRGDTINGSIEVKGGPFEGNHKWIAKRGH